MCVLKGIVTQVKKVADIVAEIHSASHAQADGVKQVHSAIASIDDTTQQNAAPVEEASAASQSTTEQAKNLIELVEYFDTTKGTVSQPEASSANDSGYQVDRSVLRKYVGRDIDCK